MFGESGSGKTVLLSSFYGAAQDQAGREDSQAPQLYDLVADDTTQGDRLLKNYFRMENSAEVPAGNRFRAEPYRFTLSLRSTPSAAERKAMPVDAVQLVWHDYPGEWFERSVSGPEEERRRIEAFRALLVSDVALLMVDGQKLKDAAGEEERYLKALFHTLRTGLVRLRDEILVGGKELVRFPRIWVLALSKADLLPEMDVDRFKALVLEKAADELGQLREAIESMVVGDEALAVGEDALLLSSARFTPGRIAVRERIGVDVILPLAAMLPFERHVTWARRQEIPAKVARELAENAGTIGTGAMALAMFGARHRLPGRLGLISTALATVVPLLSKDMVQDAASLAGEKLRGVHDRALEKKQSLAAILTGFKIDLERAEREGVLRRSRR
ncbi:ATP-binding protein [Brachybacterium conglomeratum]|uniref:ATP-binding protein n=1 Tax=Brachybacterium conglomeratum TaxID=47846 RepID=A0ABQ5RH25_9MICO|nr:ATP-binding protein [Brachybacterium conglomeratum]GLK04102.1 ATP-binding protein [Brachybacterium conglomeratum]